MTKPISASGQGLDSHFKVRIVFRGGAIVHLASKSEPVVRMELDHRVLVRAVDADWIEDARYGDTIGHVDWSEVAAVTWRYSE
jgi:hypothetical protein